MENPEITPVLKKISAIHFLYFEVTTTLAELPALVGTVVEKLYAETAAHNLFVGGPAYWNYFNFQDAAKPFDLEICLPLAKFPVKYAGKYQVKTSGPFRCVSYSHNGSWEKFPASYGILMDYIGKQKLVLAGESRELYININFENADANTTEIQVGIRD